MQTGLPPCQTLSGQSVDQAAIERETALRQIRDRLRLGQRHIADWQGGELAVSAVPGAGKSTGMAGAAAIAIARHRLNEEKT